ncbi:hypothetical protein HKD37_03G007415 [Glycine soja]
MTGPLDGPISCFLIKVDPWVLVPITFRGLFVLACRGLHALAFRGLRVLIFSVLHIHTLREYKGSRPQDAQWTRRSPTGPWGFQLWLRASIVLQGARSPGKGLRLQDTQWTRRSPAGSWSCQALITGLCQFYRVPVTSSKGIRPPTNRAFIKKYCVPRTSPLSPNRWPNPDIYHDHLFYKL